MPIHPMKPGSFTISSPFGQRVNPVTGAQEGHLGLDFAAPTGTPFYAAADGVVVEGKDRANVGGFGKWVWIDCQKSAGVDLIYGHGDPAVSKGDRVKAGDLVGYVNSHGQSTGPHLHFEVWGPPGRIGGKAVDPAVWLSESPTVASDPGFAVDVTMLTAADSGPRDPSKCQFICVHTNQGPESGSLEGLLRFLQNKANQASYNLVVDGKGRIGRSNDDGYVPWAAGPTGNQRGLHVCALGYAEQTRDEWLNPPELLDGLARVLAYWSQSYGIPLKRVTAAEIRSGMRGVCGHFDVSQAWGESDHTDPGSHFPYDVVLGKAQALISGDEGVDVATLDEINRKLDLILDQLGPNKWGPESSMGLNSAGDERTLRDGVAAVIRKVQA